MSIIVQAIAEIGSVEPNFDPDKSNILAASRATKFIDD